MAFDVFLSIPGIPGESRDASFPGTIVTPYYNWALENMPSRTGGGTGGTAGKTAFEPLTIQKNVDAASPLLMRALAAGQEIPAMTLVLRKSAGNGAAPPAFLVYEFETVLVSTIQDGGSTSGDAAPTESVTFVFGIYDLRYRTTNPDGSQSSTVIESDWSVITNSVPVVPGPGPH